MEKSILYLGDTSLEISAYYLAGVMQLSGIKFDYVSTSQPFSADMLKKGYNVVILSDYPASKFTPEQLDLLKSSVSDGGLGLVMIGGWESFVGQNANYNKTVMKDVLPVIMKDTDDRVNWFGPCIIEKTSEHPIIASLPLDEQLPVVGGFNEVKAKPNAVTVLSVRRFSVAKAGNVFSFSAESINPLLVVGTCGRGHVAAFMSDAAPHWVGGLVDWGSKRVCAQAPGAEAIEVGNYYATLFANIIRWAANDKL